MSLTHRQIFGPEPPLYDIIGFGVIDADTQQEWKSWKTTQSLFQLAGYPVGMYLSRRYFGTRPYTFGDAMMLIIGRGTGAFYGFLVADLLDFDFFSSDAMGWRWISALGAVGGVVGMDRYIRGVDYSFGQSALMLLGGIAGGAFGVGLGVVIEADETSFFDFAIIVGSLGGLALTRRIISPLREGVYRSGRSREPAVSLALQPAAMSGGLLPGVGLEIRW